MISSVVSALTQAVSAEAAGLNEICIAIQVARIGIPLATVPGVARLMCRSRYTAGFSVCPVSR